MKVIVAESAGFCFGIERALKTVYEQLGRGKTVYTFGPITHNETVCDELAQKGVRIISGEDELDKIEKLIEDVLDKVVTVEDLAQANAIANEGYRQDEQGLAACICRDLSRYYDG